MTDVIHDQNIQNTQVLGVQNLYQHCRGPNRQVSFLSKKLSHRFAMSRRCTMIMLLSRLIHSCAWLPGHVTLHALRQQGSFARRSAEFMNPPNRQLSAEVDDFGRRVRKSLKHSQSPNRPRSPGGGGDRGDDTGNGGWDNFEPLSVDNGDLGAGSTQSSEERRRTGFDGREQRARDDSSKRRNTNQRHPRASNESYRPNLRRENNQLGYDNTFGRSRKSPKDDEEGNSSSFRPKSLSRFRGGRDSMAERQEMGRTNLKALEDAGFVHLYGIASVLNAFEANRRNLGRETDNDNNDRRRFDWGLDDDDDKLENLDKAKNSDDSSMIKPEAQDRPWLFVQERAGGSATPRSSDKTHQTSRIRHLAEEHGVPVAMVDKGVLNTLSGNRPHQGYVLRCGQLTWEPLSRIPPYQLGDQSTKKLWLVLDEVVDPQNLGALLRTAYFLGGGPETQKLGVLVCAKNSAPPSPVVSAASAGALELLHVYSTNNLPRTLALAEEDGFRIIGASSSVPRDLREENSVPLYNLQDMPPLLDSTGRDQTTTLLVLGSEGHGLRSLVARCCTEFVKIPSGQCSAEDGQEGLDSGVDSLNVSVSGGILLWHLLSASNSVVLPRPALPEDTSRKDMTSQ